MADYETKLLPSEQRRYELWKAKNAPNDSGDDYDLRGLFKSGQTSDDRGHATDQFKKPNHPTFSTESQYSGKDGNTGGAWSNQDGKTHYTPSVTNLQNRSYGELGAYFKKYEPDATLDHTTSPQILQNEPKAPSAGFVNTRRFGSYGK